MDEAMNISENFAILVTNKRENKHLVFSEWQDMKICADFAMDMFSEDSYPREHFEIIILPLVKCFTLSEDGTYYTVGEGIFTDKEQSEVQEVQTDG